MQPNNHQTPEELEAETKRIADEAEALSKETPKEEEEEQEPITPKVELKEEVEPKEPIKEEEQAEPSDEEKEQLRKKAAASARESQKLYAKTRKLDQAIVEAEEIPEPTEEELAKEFAGWDMMSETEKILAKETVVSRNWRNKISEARQQGAKIEKWNETVDTFVDDPKTLLDNPELEGRTEEFKVFATQETHNSVPLNILVSAFIHEQEKARVKHKGQMFEKGSGGPSQPEKVKSDVLSLDEARVLRETDYAAWVEKLKAGKISTDL